MLHVQPGGKKSHANHKENIYTWRPQLQSLAIPLQQVAQAWVPIGFLGPQSICGPLAVFDAWIPGGNSDSACGDQCGITIPSRERMHIPPGEKENHLQKCLSMVIQFHAEKICTPFLLSNFAYRVVFSGKISAPVSIYLSIFRSFFLSIYLAVCLSACLSAFSIRDTMHLGQLVSYGFAKSGNISICFYKKKQKLSVLGYQFGLPPPGFQSQMKVYRDSLLKMK